jgi:hypothetical protein
MVFRRNKQKQAVSEAASAMRGRQAGDSSAEPHRNPLARRFLDDDEPDTIDLEEPARFPGKSGDEPPESTTRLLAGDDSVPGSDPLEDPVTGFLVVISGPGRGSVRNVGYGMNAIGRDDSQRVSLDFGDRRISRANHCVVTFDGRSAKFYIQPGEGRGLAYLDDQPVLAPTPLASGQRIQLGDTVLRFVALCDERFSWET